MFMFQFLVESLKRSFGQWDSMEAAMTSLVGFAASVVLGSVSAFLGVALTPLQLNNSIQIGLVAWLVSLVLVVTPARLWRDQKKELAKLKTPKLRILGIDYDTGRTGSEWLELVIENPTGEPIDDCYGQITWFMVANPDLRIRHPKRGHRLPWEAQRGGGLHTTIAPNHSIARLDLATRQTNESDFVRIPTWNLRPPGIPDLDAYQLPLGRYSMKVEIGSDSEAFRQSHARIDIDFTEGKLTDYKLTMVE